MTEATTPVVSLEDVAVALAGRPVLRHVSLAVPAGEFVALMGANGSGKSTLVRALLGLRPVSEGRARLFGTAVAEFRDWRRVGYVPQRASAVSGVPASVWEVVASGRLTRRARFRPMSRRDRTAVADALELVGLADRARDAVETLSGGQQQRVLIARAMAGEPELFLLDEPTAGVDLPNQQALAAALRVLKEQGSTVLLVAHELGPLAPLVDRAVVMRDGRVGYDGPPLDEDDVHSPLLGGGHAHHPRSLQHPSVPHVASPLDAPAEREERPWTS